MYARSLFTATIWAALAFCPGARAQTVAQSAAGGLIAVCQNTLPDTCTNTGGAQASSNGGIAIGEGANSISGSALAIGPRAVGYGDGAIAIGPSANAQNDSAIAVGNGSAANTGSVSLGKGSTSGNYSVAIGYGTQTRNGSAVAIGNAASSDTSGVAIGRAATTGQSGIAIGNGTSSSANAMAFGTSATATDYGAAFGYSATAGAQYTLALGYQSNVASGSTGGVAIGAGTAATQYATAIGYLASATDFGTAIGEGASVASGAVSSVAIGAGSTVASDMTNVVSFGSPTLTRRLINISPGVAGTDAVNIDQFAGIVGVIGASLDARGALSAPTYAIQGAQYHDITSAFAAVDNSLTTLASSGGGGTSGPQGPQGAKGDTGATGAAGPQGPAGSGADADTLEKTKDYVDQGDAGILDHANAHADQGDASTLSQAEDWTHGYVDHAVGEALQAAKDYTDMRFSQINTRLDRLGASQAASTAMASNFTGDNSIAAGVGLQGGRDALAVGYRHVTAGGVSFSLHGAFAGEEHQVGAGIGASW